MTHQVYQIHVLLSVNVQHCTEKVLAASNRFITFPASQSSVGFVSSSSDCLFSSGLQHEKHTHSHRLSFRETLEMFFFFFPLFPKALIQIICWFDSFN